MKKIENIQDVYDAEINLIIKQSSLLLQKKEEGFNGELKTSGTIVENYIKETIKKHIPSGYRICSGYVATTDSILNTDNLIQHDIIIVDDRIPTLYKFGVSDIEIVQVEAVCGIIEVKRTLTKKSLVESIKQLKKTREILDNYSNGIKSKLAANNVAGPTLNVATHSPFYGIIGLGALQNEVDESFINQTIKSEIHDFIDMVWSLSDGFLLRFCVEKEGIIYYPLTVTREMGTEYSLSQDFIYGENQIKGQVFRIALSVFRTWISNTSGVRMSADINQKYFGI